jgi:AraC-like DNA-binding protein
VRLCHSRDLLRQSPQAELRITAVARMAGMSPYHFIRQFAAVFGVTPHQYRLQARLDRARQLLATDEYSVTQVCMAIGFSSLGTFSDLFVRRVGVAPSSYRRRLRTVCAVPGTWQQLLAPGCFSLMAAAARSAISEKHSSPALPDSSAPLNLCASLRSNHEDQADQHSRR